MRSQGQLVAGVLIILLGVVILLSNVFNINLWGICWPSALILLGLWLLVRPRLVEQGTGVSLVPIGAVDRAGAWQVSDEEFWVFVGDIDLDLTVAEIPEGVTRLRTYGFVGDVELIVPRDVGVSLSSTAFVSDIKAFGDRHEHFLTPLHLDSDNYETAVRKIRLETHAFVGDVKIRQG